MKKMNATLDAHEARLIDGSLLPESALVELEESCLKDFKYDLDGEWNIYPEKAYPLPDTKKSIKKRLH